MGVNLKGRSIGSLGELTREEIEQILKTAQLLKSQLRNGVDHPLLKGKTLAMIFEKPSTRTRVSFEVGMWQLGGIRPLSQRKRPPIRKRGIHCRYRTHPLPGMWTGIMARVFHHQTILELIKYSNVPVINGLSDFTHPCQGLADLFTIYEKKGGVFRT